MKHSQYLHTWVWSCPASCASAALRLSAGHASSPFMSTATRLRQRSEAATRPTPAAWTPRHPDARSRAGGPPDLPVALNGDIGAAVAQSTLVVRFLEDGPRDGRASPTIERVAHTTKDPRGAPAEAAELRPQHARRSSGAAKKASKVVTGKCSEGVTGVVPGKCQESLPGTTRAPF